jgi:hypothetical protein
MVKRWIVYVAAGFSVCLVGSGFVAFELENVIGPLWTDTAHQVYQAGREQHYPALTGPDNPRIREAYSEPLYLGDQHHLKEAWLSWADAFLDRATRAKEDVFVTCNTAFGSLDDIVDASHQVVHPQYAIPPEDDLTSKVAIRVITTPKSKDRQASITEQMNVYGFENWRFQSRWDKVTYTANIDQVHRWMWADAPMESEGYYMLNYMDHLDVLREFVSNNDGDYLLVAEDDSTFTPHFRSKLAWVLSRGKDAFSAVMLGGCLGMHEDTERKDVTLASKWPGRLTAALVPRIESRCANMYLMTRDAVIDFLDGTQHLSRTQPQMRNIDHKMNDVFEAVFPAGNRVYWMEPPLSYESSKVFLWGERSCNHTTPV